MVNFIVNHWLEICLAYLFFQNILKGVRDATDSTPQTDDNNFERFCTIYGKFSAYFVAGKRS